VVLTVVVLVKTVDGAAWSVPSGAELHRRGHRVVFALPGHAGRLPDRVREEGMEVVIAAAPLMGASPARQPAAIRRLRHQFVDELKADVVVSHLIASAMASRVALARSGVPHVYVSHGPLYLENPVIKAVERVMWRMDAHHVGTSAAMLRAYRDLGVPDSRQSLIPNAIGSEWSAVDREGLRVSTRERLGIDPDAFVIVNLAYFYAPKRLVHRGRGIKGHDVLLEAWRRHKLAGGPGELLLVGGGFGPGGVQYRDQIHRQYRHVPGVHWIGGVDDVRPYLCAADVNVAPSLSENLGSASEAGAFGLPTVASAVGALPEMVNEGTTGWLVPPDDVTALAAALARAGAAGENGRAVLGESARARSAELHDAATVRARFADVVERVARQHHR
jgi:glycosyltransferase involved in cell wall biosynthesis